MARSLSFDTSFLIDVHREVGSDGAGPAHDFLKQHAECVMCVSATAFGEFAEGFDDPNDLALKRLAAAVRILDIDSQTALVYGEHARKLRAAGRLIGANDLWIGASALRHGTPLVTRNGEHFRRLSGLMVMEF